MRRGYSYIRPSTCDEGDNTQIIAISRHNISTCHETRTLSHTFVMFFSRLVFA